MRSYKVFYEPQGYKISSIYDMGPEVEDNSNEVNASNGGKATCKSSQIHSFNRFGNR